MPSQDHQNSKVDQSAVQVPDMKGRQIKNLAAGTDPQDAVNLSQLKEIVGGDNTTVTNVGNKVVISAGGGGAVTSVGLTMPAEFSVAGSPITSAGTLAVTKATEPANKVWAGPTSGGAAQPTFRSLVVADVPNPLTTKGDIIVAGTSGVQDRLAVGANGKVVTANSAATDGVDYEAPIALTTTGSSGAATLTPGNPYTLNVPNYAGGGGGAPTTSKYVLGGPDGTLTNSVVNYYAYFGPDASPASAGSLDDEFNAGSLSGSWTWVNQGSATATLSKSTLVLFSPAHSGTNWQYIYQTCPATPWEVQCKCVMQAQVGSNFWSAGVILSDSSGKIIAGPSSSTTSTATVNYYSNPTTFSSAPALSGITGAYMSIWYFRVKDDGVNLTFWWSYEGTAWAQILQASRTAFLASGPTRVGLGVDSENSQPVYMACDWFRRTL